MRFSHLWQPRSLLFWQMVVFNLLSSLCAWGLRTLPLNTAGMLLLGAIALLNCGFGMLAMWRLLKGQDQGQGQRPDQATGSSSASTASTSE